MWEQAPKHTKIRVLQVHQHPANMCRGVVGTHHLAPLAACEGEVRKRGRAPSALAGKVARQLLRGSLLAKMGHPEMLGVPLGRDGPAALATHHHPARLGPGRCYDCQDGTAFCWLSWPCFVGQMLAEACA